MASTAPSTDPNAVRKTTGTPGCASCSRAKTSSPDIPGIRMSSSTSSGGLGRASATPPGFNPYAAVVHIEEAGSQEQPQPQALPPRTMGNKRLEQVLPDAFGNAWPIVFDSEEHLGSRRAVWFHADPDRRVLTPFESVEGVAQQTAHHFAHHMPGQVDARDIRDFLHHSNPLLMR